MAVIKPTNEKPWEWTCIEWENLRVTNNMVQVVDEYKGVTVEIMVDDTTGDLIVYAPSDEEMLYG